MKFFNMFGTDSISVMPGKLYDETHYVGMSASAGSLQFVWTMSTAEARTMGQYLLEIANQAEAEILATQAIEMAVAA